MPGALPSQSHSEVGRAEPHKMAMSSFKSVTLLCCSCYLLLVAFGQQVWAAPQPEGAVPEVPLKNGASSTGKPMGESPKAGSPQKDHDQSEEEELPGDEAAVFHLFEFEHDIKALIKSIRKDVTSYPSRGPEDDCSSSNMTDVKSGVELPVCKQVTGTFCISE